MTLMLHAGAEPIDFDGLRALPTPPPTATHHPLPHHDLINMVIYALTYFGHSVEKQEFGVTPDGNRFYGQLTLKSEYSEHVDFVGLANSHDKTLPIRIGMGSTMFVCDNSAFLAATDVKRKHTAKMKHQLPSIIAEIVEPLREQRVLQNRLFDLYRGTPLTDAEADHLIMEMWRRGIINTTRIAEVAGEWENPTCNYGSKTAHRLFNAATWSLKPKVVEQPRLTQELHKLMDTVCEGSPQQKRLAFIE